MSGYLQRCSTAWQTAMSWYRCEQPVSAKPKKPQTETCHTAIEAGFPQVFFSDIHRYFVFAGLKTYILKISVFRLGLIRYSSFSSYKVGKANTSDLFCFFLQKARRGAVANPGRKCWLHSERNFREQLSSHRRGRGGYYSHGLKFN